ncbi:MAG: SdrD B-like domain-containing protein, partial [Planctomycetaceae bacterium]
VSNATLANGAAVNDDVGEEDNEAIICVLPTATIGDLVWIDVSGGTSGVYDSGIDTPLPGVKVELQSSNGQTLFATTTTDENGEYKFTGLVIDDGSDFTWKVVVDDTGLDSTVDTNDTSGSPNGESKVTIANPAGDAGPADNLNVDFGFELDTAVIYGNVWQDYNADTIRDSQDTGFDSVTVQLLDSAGTVVTSVITDPTGNYRFHNVAAGNYGIQVQTGSLPAVSGVSWQQTTETPGDGTLDDFYPTNDLLTVVVGQVYGNYDFAYTSTGTGSIGDEVFFDFDRDLIFDSSEEPIGDVDVRLYRDLNANNTFEASEDILIATTSTDSSGLYLFSNLSPGRYLVQVHEGDSEFPSSVTSVSSNPRGVTLLSGSTRRDVDFGYYPAGSGVISGSVWHDKSLDGLITTGEEYISQITVELWVDLNGDGTFHLFSTSESDDGGSFQFTELPFGNYEVRVAADDADMLTTPRGLPYSPTTDSTKTVQLSSATPTGTTDFGFAARPSIGDLVFFDNNRNGTQDTAENGIPNVTVQLFLDTDNNGVPDGAAIATVVTADGTGTDPAGWYEFPNLEPSTTGQSYFVSVDTSTLPYAMLNSSDPDRDGVAWEGVADTTGTYPDADAADERIILGTSSYTGADFGFVPAGVIGDLVWLDQNENGVQDDGEIGLSNVTVTASNGGDVRQVQTDSDGFYSFSDLSAGTWTVALSGNALSGLKSTYDADGGLDNSTDVVIDSTGTVTSSFDNLAVDFGLRLDGVFSIAGTVVTNDSR